VVVMLERSHPHLFSYLVYFEKRTKTQNGSTGLNTEEPKFIIIIYKFIFYIIIFLFILFFGKYFIIVFIIIIFIIIYLFTRLVYSSKANVKFVV
jgi:hypothetical protein